MGVKPRHPLLWAGLVVGVLGVVAWRVVGSGPSAPDTEVTRSMKFTHAGVWLDSWADDEMPTWKAVLKRYVNDLNLRDVTAVRSLLDPDDAAGRDYASTAVSRFASSAGPGVEVALTDIQTPGYSAFCLRYPGGDAQSVAVTKGLANGRHSKWIIQFIQGDQWTDCMPRKTS